MTTERPTTPRAALTALADAIEHDGDATWLPASSVVDVLRREAGTYPDEPESEPLLAELAGGEAPDFVRATALNAAARWLTDAPLVTADVVQTARAFEAYLRGGR